MASNLEAMASNLLEKLLYGEKEGLPKGLCDLSKVLFYVSLWQRSLIVEVVSMMFRSEKWISTVWGQRDNLDFPLHTFMAFSKKENAKRS